MEMFNSDKKGAFQKFCNHLLIYIEYENNHSIIFPYSFHNIIFLELWEVIM